MKERVARAREKSFSGPGNGKNTPKFSKVRHVGSRVHQKLFKSAQILSGEKIFGFLLGSACSADDFDTDLAAFDVATMLEESNAEVLVFPPEVSGLLEVKMLSKLPS